ncbi:MAG: type VI secretion system baseplate subunit TssE [Algicola sp.]|nr:type VI secretion system baseplate subunit TssE [Algicola sp.]
MNAFNELTIFQRLAQGKHGANQKGQLDASRLRQSIAEHLQNMFNTRQGSSSANPEYGLPDFNDLDMEYGFADAVSEIKKSIKRQLELHEPRIKNPKVAYLPNEDNPLELRFEIHARFNMKGQSGRIRFETDGHCGSLKVKS